VPLILPFLAPGWFFGHDNMPLIRLFETDVMVRAGEVPVRWYPDVAAGYGSPHPQYYAPLFYVLAEIFRLGGVSLTVSLKAAVVVVVLATSWAVFRWAREFFGEAGGVVAAAACSYAPYHMLDLYVRTAFSELTVFLFLPLVLLSFHRLSLRPSPGRIAAVGASLGGLCLAHTVTAMLVPPILAAYLLLLAWGAASRSKFLASAAAAALLGFALAAFFLLPLVAERGAVETEIYAAAYFDYRKHFVEIPQLLRSPWGFGLSREGPADGISFRIGLLQLAGCVVAAIRWRRLRGSSRDAAAHALFAAALSAAGILMSLAISKPLWTAVPLLRYVQFPWRFLMLPAMGMAFLCGAAFGVEGTGRAAGGKAGGESGSAEPAGVSGRGREPPAPPRPAPKWAVAVVCAIFAAGSVEMFGFRQRILLERIGFGGDHTDMRERDASEAAAAPTVFTREFVREQTLHWFDHLPPGGYPYPPQEDLSRPKAEIVRGAAELNLAEIGPVRYRIGVRASRPSLLRLNVYRFPGWTWRLDGTVTGAAASEGRRPVLLIEVPAGEHTLEATFERTGARWAGDVTSLAAAGVLAGLAATGLRRPWRNG